MDWALVFSDETVGYLADFTTVLVNGGIIGAAIYAYVRRREFLEWLRNAYAALLALIAELRAANELARAKAAPAPAAPPSSTSDQGQPIPEPVQRQLTPPTPPPPPRPASPQPAPQAENAQPGPKLNKEPSANRPTLAWGIGAAVAAFILIVALVRTSSTPTPAALPRSTLQPPVVASAPTHPQPPPLSRPPPREVWSYTVQPNESCWAIAERAEPDPAKTGRLWASIVALNPTLCSSRREDVLRPGSIIAIPPTVQPAALIQ